MVSPIIAAILVLLAFILIDAFSPLLADISIFFYFLFAFINISGSQPLATFYLFGSLFVILFRVIGLGLTTEDSKEPVINLKFLKNFPFLGVGLGIAIFAAMRLLQGTAPGAIIGVPSLAISSQVFSITTIMLLGVVETRMFFTLLKIADRNKGFILALPVVGAMLAVAVPILGILLVALLFGIFHLTAYQSVSSIVFAVLVMGIWIGTFLLTKSDRPANISHMLWNGSVQLNRVLGIAIGGSS